MTFTGTWHITEMENWKKAAPAKPIGDVNMLKDFLPLKTQYNIAIVGCVSAA
ncbi:MAG: hypothetical protein F6J92_24350 [Symploca sp. SIO1A3]|nr:hypothetical protein [Symploca sp. SIO1A3]